jgi:hypothetical protein
MIAYEYHNNQLGVRAGVLIEGRNADENSLRLIGDRGLRKRIEKGYIKRLRACGPNTPTLLKWDTLSGDWQKLLVETFGEPQRQVRQSLFERHFTRDSVAIEFYYNYQLADGKLLPDEIIDEYTLNASVLNTVETIYTKRYELRKNLRGGVIDIWTIVINECNRFRDIQRHTLPSNGASLRRKFNEYKKDGYVALIHGNFCNKSAIKVDEHVGKLLNSMFAHQDYKPTATEIARQYDGFLNGYVDVINNSTGEIYDPKEYPKLSQATITAYLAKWVNRAATHAIRSGDRQVLMGKYRPYHSLGMPKFANSIISIDDRVAAFKMPNGKRVWFYNGVDLGSQAYVAWVYGEDKDGIILDFYRQLVRNYSEWGFNLPAELECESSLNSTYRETFLSEGSMFQYVRIEANNARGKRIEGYNREMRYELEKHWEGYNSRPFAKSEANQNGPGETIDLPYDQIVEICLKSIETWNNKEHLVIKGKSRWEVFTENQNPDVKPTNWRAFLPYLGYKTQTSCNTGIIRLNNTECLIGENGSLAFSDRLISLMSQIEGKDLDIYWLDDNNSKVLKALVYLRGTDRCVCEAVSKPVYNRARIEQTPADLEARTQMSKYVASVDGFINSSRRKVDHVTVIDERPATLNNKFQISQLKRPSSDIPVYDGVEIMEEPDEFETALNAIATGNKVTLLERF